MTKNQLSNVFIHGSFANARSWKKIIGKLDQNTSNIAINLPGHGGAPDPQDFLHPSLEPEIMAIRSKLNETGVLENGLHLIGHSYGGVVALGITMSNALPVKKLTLFEPVDVSVLSVFGEIAAASDVRQFMQEYQAAIKIGEFNACARVIDFWGGEGSFDQIPEHIQKQMNEMTKNNLRHWEICKNNGKLPGEYQNLQIPVTLVHGSKSNSTAINICTSLNNNFPNSKIQVIDSASHFMITSHSNECAKIIKMA